MVMETAFPRWLERSAGGRPDLRRSGAGRNGLHVFGCENCQHMEWRKSPLANWRTAHFPDGVRVAASLAMTLSSKPCQTRRSG